RQCRAAPRARRARRPDHPTGSRRRGRRSPPAARPRRHRSGIPEPHRTTRSHCRRRAAGKRTGRRHAPAQPARGEEPATVTAVPPAPADDLQAALAEAPLAGAVTAPSADADRAPAASLVAPFTAAGHTPFTADSLACLQLHKVDDDSWTFGARTFGLH